MAKRVGPYVYITNFPRTANKATWKWYYRLQRVIVRESEQVAIDTMLYGTGYMQFNYGEDPKYIPIQQVRLWA